MSETVLWTNPSPANAMGTTTVTLSQSMADFKYIKFVYRISTSDSSTASLIMSVEDYQNSSTTTYRLTMLSYYSAKQWVRTANRVSDTSIQFEIAYRINGQENTNVVSIPQQVIGLK